MKVDARIDTTDFEALLREWGESVKTNLERAYTQIVFRWHAEAVKRIPVKTGRARNAIFHSVRWEGYGDLVGEIGGNLRYMDFLEFGTRFIAGGRVQEIGPRSDVTDMDAIHNWPAKAGEATDLTAVAMELGTGRRVNNRLQYVGGPQEQMPWLRPAWMAIQGWALKQIEAAMRPPRAKT